MQYCKHKEKPIKANDVRIGDVVTLNNGMRGKVSAKSRWGYSMKCGKHGKLYDFYAGVVTRIDRRKIGRVRIYQIDPIDSEYAFRDYANVRAHGRATPPPELYTVVFDGQLDTDNLDEICRIFNVAHPKDYTGRSLSVSDIVELYDEKGSRFFYCDSFGFKKIRFTPLNNINPIPGDADMAFPCCLYDTDRTLDWCENNCGKYYSCDTVVMAIDDLKDRDGE